MVFSRFSSKTKTANLWTQAKKPWKQQATEYFILYVQNPEAWDQALDRFYEALRQASESGDLAAVQDLIQTWLEQGTPFWTNEQPTAVVNLVATLLRFLGQIFLDLAARMGETEFLFRWWNQALALMQWATEKALERAMKEIEAERARLERLEHVKAGFIVVVGHELRTPLTILDANLQLLRQILNQEGPLGKAELERIVHGLEQGVRRLRMLIESVLDLSVVESGKVAQRPQPIWLDRLLYRVVEDMQPLARERRIALRLEPRNPPKARVLGDPTYLTKAMYHLLDNALKYTPSGGQVTVRMAVYPDEKEVEIQVQDTGIGIPKEAQETIFERFVRLGDPNVYSSERNQFKGGGAGLGLAIVRGVVQAHGGRVWVESPGYDEERLPGSTFFVRLPLATEEEIRQAIAAFAQEG